MLKSRKKKNTLKLAGIALLAAAMVGVGATGAVIRHNVSLKNVVKTPTVQVSVDEDLKGDVEEWKKPKKVSFKNEGNADVFIRVSVSETWEKDGELLANTNTAGDGESIVKMFNKDNVLANKLFPESDWEYNEADGWYYYKYVVEAGKSTPEILTAVDFSKLQNVTSDDEELGKYVDAHYQLHFQVEAVQASDNYRLNRDAVKEVFGISIFEVQPDGWDTNKYTAKIDWITDPSSNISTQSEGGN